MTKIDDEIRAGDLVWRNGGGALMRVTRIADGNAVCEWVTPRGIERGTLAIADLERIGTKAPADEP